jgi:hypothetical protein
MNQRTWELPWLTDCARLRRKIKPSDWRSIFSVILGTDGGTLGVLKGVPSGGRGQSRASSSFILRLKIDHMSIWWLEFIKLQD